MLHTLRGRWTDRIVTKDRRTGVERVLFAAPPPDGPQAATSLKLRPLPHDIEAAAYAASPAAVAAAAAIAVATGAATPTLVSSDVWSGLTSALHAHDWHAARDAKHAVEEAQRVRGCSCQPFLDVLGADSSPHQKARQVREEAGVAWEPRFFQAHAEHAGAWVLKAGVAAALTAALAQAPPAEQVPPLPPPTPAFAARRSADGIDGWQ